MRMNAGIYVEMPGQLKPFETPFDTPGIPVRPCQFIYLGNRTLGRFSGLLPLDYDWRALGWALADYFPMGYTNLYHIQKRLSLHPDPAWTPIRPDTRKSVRPYLPRGIGTLPQEGRLFYVFREPLAPENRYDVIGLMFSEQRARAMAERYVTTYGRRALVGLMLRKMTWH